MVDEPEDYVFQDADEHFTTKREMRKLLDRLYDPMPTEGVRQSCAYWFLMLFLLMLLLLLVMWKS